MTAPESLPPDPDDPPDEVTELPRAEAPAVPIDFARLEEESVELGWFGRGRLHALAALSSAPYRLGWLARRSPVWLFWLLRDPLVGLARVAVLAFNWLHMTEERVAIRQMESKDAKAKAKRDVNKDGRFRYIVAAILAGTYLLAHVVALLTAYAWIAYTEWIGLYLLLVLLGHKPKANADDPVRRRGPLTHGTSARSLRRDLEEGFAAKKMPDVGVIGLTVNKYGWHGIFETEQVIDDKLIEHLERWVHAPEGSLLVTVDPRNAAAHPFTLLIEDPLANSSTPSVPDAPRDIRALANIGRHLFGKPLLVNLRQHIGLIGRSGSGKSSGFWVLIDWVTSCFNAEAVGIDLSQGPALPAWRRAMLRVGTNREEAVEILVDSIQLAMDRNAELARRAELDDDDSDDENWVPTATDKARYIFMDEFHLSADDKEILGLVKTGIRVGRKACVFFVFGTPGASKEDVGSVIIKGMIGLKILFACIQQDVTNFLGGKMIEQGWRPDKLRPSAGGDAKDAGKAYVWDGAHQQPEVVRLGRLTLADCKQRARARASVTLTKGPESQPAHPAVQQLLAVLDEAELDKISLGWLEKFVTVGDYEMGYDRLRRELDALGITTRRVNKGPWTEANPWGYFRSDLG